MSWLTRTKLHGVSALEIILIIVIGVPVLNWGIPAYFHMMPLAEQCLTAIGKPITEMVEATTK